MNEPIQPPHRVDDAIAAIAAGDFVVVVDDVDRENEGDLVMSADAATAQSIAFMVRYTSGLICVPMTGARLAELDIPMMVSRPSDTHDTAFTVSVDYVHGTTTGISAADRAATIRALAAEESVASDFARPGHIFPLRYVAGGVLSRPGHTEAAVDLARLARRAPVGVVCEVVAEDGSMARGTDLERFAKEWDLPIVSISELVAYRRAIGDQDTAGGLPEVRRKAAARFPTDLGEFRIVGYDSAGDEAIAMTKGTLRGDEPVLARIHSECLTGDALGSRRCDCRSQLRESMRRIDEAGRGVILYMRGHEGRGVGLMSKLAAYALQDQGMDTVEANEQLGLPSDARDFSVAAAVLRDLGVRRVRLLTNNPNKRDGLERGGVEVVERLPLVVAATAENHSYLTTKATKLGHLIDVDGDD